MNCDPAPLVLFTVTDHPWAVGNDELILASRLSVWINAPPLKGTVCAPFFTGQVTDPGVCRPLGSGNVAEAIA